MRFSQLIEKPKADLAYHFGDLKAYLSTQPMSGKEMQREMIGTFTAVFQGNLMAWAGMTYPATRNPLAQFAVLEYLQFLQESKNDILLAEFATECEAEVEEQSYKIGEISMKPIRILLSSLNSVGFKGTVLLAYLQVTSQLYLPLLGEWARRSFGAQVSPDTLLNTHEDCKYFHQRNFASAVEAEAKMGYPYPEASAKATVLAANKMLMKVFHFKW